MKELTTKDTKSTKEEKNLRALPDGWAWMTVGDVVSFEYGKGLTQDKRDASGKVPVYGSNGIVGYHSTALVDKPCLVIGRKGAAGAVHKSDAPCWPIDTTYFAIPPENVNLHFLYHLFLTLDFASLDRSTAIPGLNRNDAYAINIPLPPLPEQERIVARLEELLSDLEAGVAALMRVRAGLKRYKASVLKAACEGKLSDNKGLGDGELPDGWRWTTIGDVADTTSGGTPSRKNPEYFQGTIPWVKSGELGDGFISKTEEKITDDALRNSSAKLFPSGTVLVALYGATVGKVGILKIEAASNQAVCALFPRNNSFTAKFMFYWLMSQRRELINKSMGGAQPNISQGIVRSHLFPLFPLPEQERIVAEIERRLESRRVVEAAVEAGLKRAGRLRQAVLRSAFEGRL